MITDLLLVFFYFQSSGFLILPLLLKWFLNLITQQFRRQLE